MAQMGLDTAIRLSAEVKGGGNIDRVKKSLQDLAKSGQTTAREMGALRSATFQMARANDNTIAGIRNSISAFRGLQEQAAIGSRQFQRYGAEIQKLEGKLRGLDGAAQSAGDSMGRKLAAGLASSLATIGAGRAISGSLGAVVASEESERRLRSLSQGLDDYSRVQTTATAAAQKFGIAQTQANQEFAQIYARLRPVGLTLEEISTVYNGFNTAAKLSGTTSAEASAAFLQLSQALGTGVLRGEELNSVFEQTPAVVQGIAQVMGVPIGQIRELAKEGKITGDIVLTALGRIERDGAPKLAEAMKGPAQQFRNLQIAGQELQIQFGQSLLPTTIALTKAATGILEQTSKLPEPVRQVGAAAAVAGVAVLGLTTAMSAIGGISAATKAMQAYTASTGVATKAQVGLNLAVLANPWVLATAGIIAATVAAYKFIEPFREFVNTYPERFKLFWGSIAADAQASFKRITDAATAMGQFLAKGVQNIADKFATMFGWIRARAGDALRAIGIDGQWLAGAMQSVSTTIGNVFSAAFDFVQSRWQQTISNMINYSNPFTAMLTTMGINVGDAATRAMQTGQQRLQAAGVPNTYTVGGITYNTATGRPVAGAAPFALQAPRTLPGAPSAPVLPGGGAAGAGGATSGGGSAPSFQPSSRARALIAAAQKLGVSPLDLATIISFETGGTFSPSIRGGAGGNYQGLIQFGAPERRQYGVTSGQSFEEQVMGPVVRYFQDRFQGAGMSTQGASLLDLYTTVLAGNPRANRNARDSFGTSPISGVQRMGPHRQKALATFFGGSTTNVGFGAVEQAESMIAGYDEQQQAAEKLKQEQDQLTEKIQESIKARTDSIVQLNKETELLKAVSDEERIQIENAYEANNIKEQYRQLKAEALDLDKEAQRLGIENNLQEQTARLKAEERHALANLQLKTEQDLNKVYEERTRLFKEFMDQVAMPTAYNQLEQQRVVLDEILEKYPAIGGAADAAADLATRGLAEVVTGAKSAKDVFVDFLNGVASALLDAAKKMIAQYIAIGIARMFAGFASSTSGSSFQPSTTGPFQAAESASAFNFNPGAMVGRAVGGPTMAGQPYTVGERGPELFVPYQSGTIIPAEATEALEALNNASLQALAVPFQRDATTRGGNDLAVPFQRGMEGLSVPFQRDTTGGAAGDRVANGASIDVRFETIRVGDLDVVTREEAQRIGRESAQRGAELAQKRLSNNPTARRAVGMS